jgi:hypothetical protein
MMAPCSTGLSDEERKGTGTNSSITLRGYQQCAVNAAVLALKAVRDPAGGAR